MTYQAAGRDHAGINNYGPYQFPEKLIPLMIANAFEDRPLPVYGDGMQVRDWLYVEDHCRGILAVLRRGATARSTTSAATARCRTWKWSAGSGADGQAGEPDSIRDRPPGARPAVCPVERKTDAGNRLAAVPGFRSGPGGDRRVVPEQSGRGSSACGAANTGRITSATTAAASGGLSRFSGDF